MLWRSWFCHFCVLFQPSRLWLVCANFSDGFCSNDHAIRIHFFFYCSCCCSWVLCFCWNFNWPNICWKMPSRNFRVVGKCSIPLSVCPFLDWLLSTEGCLGMILYLHCSRNYAMLLSICKAGSRPCGRRRLRSVLSKLIPLDLHWNLRKRSCSRQ